MLGAGYVLNSHFGISTRLILIYYAYCSNYQNNLFDCNVNQFPYSYPQCNNYQEAGVKCECELIKVNFTFGLFIVFLIIHKAPCTDGDIHLYSGISNHYGNVRVCINGTWSYICASGNSVVDDNLASVICTTLGYSSYGKCFCIMYSSI